MLASYKLLGIDPGYDRVGWAIGEVQGTTLKDIWYGLIQTNIKATLLERYQAIDTELSQILQLHQPSEAAVETLFFSQNKTTALHVAEARGVIISTLFRHSVQFFEYNPMQIKVAVAGFGGADKAAVEKMVRLQLGHLIKAQEKVQDDTMDALGILITHSTSRKLARLSR